MLGNALPSQVGRLVHALRHVLPMLHVRLLKNVARTDVVTLVCLRAPVVWFMLDSVPRWRAEQWVPALRAARQMPHVPRTRSVAQTGVEEHARHRALVLLCILGSVPLCLPVLWDLVSWLALLMHHVLRIKNAALMGAAELARARPYRHLSVHLGNTAVHVPGDHIVFSPVQLVSIRLPNVLRMTTEFTLDSVPLLLVPSAPAL